VQRTDVCHVAARESVAIAPPRRGQVPAHSTHRDVDGSAGRRMRRQAAPRAPPPASGQRSVNVRTKQNHVWIRGACGGAAVAAGPDVDACAAPVRSVSMTPRPTRLRGLVLALVIICDSALVVSDHHIYAQATASADQCWAPS